MNKYYKIKESSHIENGYELWKDYRKALTKKLISKSQGKNIIIFGAGECNDINIFELSNSAKKILLVDNDREALERAIKHYGKIKNIEIKVVDLWGIKEQHFIKYEKMLQRSENVQVIKKYLYNCIIDIDKENTEIVSYKWDYGVAVGLHSQINVMFANLLYEYRNNYSQEELEKIVETISEMNYLMAAKVNEKIFGYCKEVILGNEFGNYSKEEDAIKVAKDFEEKKYMQVENNNRIEGAYQCQWDISCRLDEETNELIELFYLIWPFNEKKYYLMFFLIVN